MQRKTLLTIIFISLLLFCFLVYISLQIAPFFSISILIIVLIVLLYVLTESWITHAANEFENRFWSFISFIFTFVCVFIHDSPCYLGNYSSFLGWFIIILISFLTHTYDRHLRREKLKRVDTLKRISSSSLLNHTRNEMHKALEEVNSLLEGIDNYWLSSTFLNLFMLPKVLYNERKIISIFTEASTQELNYIVTNCHLGLLIYKMKDHKIWRVYSRTILIDTLAIHRIGELSVLARACVLDGLQRMKLSAHEKGELYVKNIITKTYMDDLSELKSTTDSKGDFYSLHKLIFQDIQDAGIRASILDHISKQARTQRAHMDLGTSNTSKRRSQYAWRKILSDVDDTLSCSGGSYPAGMDTSYPKKALYPGVLAFYRELDLGCNGPEVWNPDRNGNLVFLSARPHVYKDALEQHSYDMFKKLQKTRGLYTSPSLLAGSLVTGGEFMVAGDMEPLAQQKYENFKQYASLYMEYDFIFVGDNGQGDVRVAELVENDSKFSKNLERVYVHEVQPIHLTHARNRSKILTKSCRFVCYFTTYVDAAIDAYKNKLIRLSGLRRIAEEAVYDFERIPWDLISGNTLSGELQVSQKRGNLKKEKTKKSKYQNTLAVQLKESFRKRYMRLLELNHSLTIANTILVSGGLKPVNLLRFQCLYPRGSAVMTLFGLGVVEKFRYHDGIYEVRLAMGLRDDCTGGNMAYLRSDSLTKLNRPRNRSFVGVFWGSQSTSTSSQLVNQNNHIININNNGNNGNSNVNVNNNINNNNNNNNNINSGNNNSGNNNGGNNNTHTIINQWIAWTPYGVAKIILERPNDGIIVLKSKWGSTLYLHASKVVKMKTVSCQFDELSPKSSQIIKRIEQNNNDKNSNNKNNSNNNNSNNNNNSTKDHRVSFWGRLFGYKHPETTIKTSTDNNKNNINNENSESKDDRDHNNKLGSNIIDNDIVNNNKNNNDNDNNLDSTKSINSFHNKLEDSQKIPENINILESLFEELEKILVNVTENFETITIEELFCSSSNNWIELSTLYGKGKLLDLIIRSDFVLLKVYFYWGGIGYLSLNTIKSFKVFDDSNLVILQSETFFNTSSYLSYKQLYNTFNSKNILECIENIKKIRGTLHLIDV